MRLDLLKELVHHCRTEPGLDRFDFNQVLILDPVDGKSKCGCLLGEASCCWPEGLSLEPHGVLNRKGKELRRDSESDMVYWSDIQLSVLTASLWFDITLEDAKWLFMPSEYHSVYGPNDLTGESTMEEVLSVVERYIELNEPSV